jgi:hypothetical protein
MKTIFLPYTRELLHLGQFLFNCNHFISVNCRIVITTIEKSDECDSRYHDITVNCRMIKKSFFTTISEPTNDQKIVFYNSLLQQLFNRYYNNYYRRVMSATAEIAILLLIVESLLQLLQKSDECDSRITILRVLCFLFKDMFQ